MKAVLILVLGGFFTWGILSSSKNEKVEQNKLDWTKATSSKDIDNAWESSKPALFFKHSTRCGLSLMVLEDFENEWNISKNKCEIVFIDIFKHRDVSDYLAEKTGVRHHSPQVFLLKDGAIKYSKTHMDIKVFELKKLLETL